ncbi:hypothetical protein Scep_028164 [Stephania cephalantha]|uniref:Uncharacterized protein n=1 Tax=Stephania cephalantha TaxID=152367 RepID=A0AAP0HLI7_9MAGN
MYSYLITDGFTSFQQRAQNLHQKLFQRTLGSQNQCLQPSVPRYHGVGIDQSILSNSSAALYFHEGH